MVDSDSVGDPGRFRSLAELERGLAALPAAPARSGRVALIVARGKGGLRSCLERARLEPDRGVPGDSWRGSNPDASLTVIRRDVLELLANGQPATLAGDNLVLDLDLSTANLPAGTRVRVGRAVLAVTPKPHNGCRKFKARFGEDALRFVSDPARRPLNLRGIYMRTVEAGDVAPGDPVEVL